MTFPAREMVLLAAVTLSPGAQQPQQRDALPQRREHGCLFPSPGPIVGADPSRTHPVKVMVPTALVPRSEHGRIMLGLDAKHMIEATILVGEKMVLGHQVETYVFKKGGEASRYPGTIQQTGDEKFDLVNDRVDGPPPDKVERVDFVIFETDTPPQHHWMPEGKNYRVLWRKSFFYPAKREPDRHP